MASLSLGAGKVEMKWEVGMRSKKKKEEHFDVVYLWMSAKRST